MIEPHREGCIKGGAGCGGAQMQTVVGLVCIVEYIVHTSLKLEGEGFLFASLVTEGMGACESPELVAFSVAVQLIVSLGGCSSVDACSPCVLIFHRVVPCQKTIPLVVCHAVDDDTMKGIVFCVVKLCVSIEIAVSKSCCPLSVDAVAQGNVHTIGLGGFEVLVFPRFDGHILGVEVDGCFAVGDGDEGNHVVHLVVIACGSGGETSVVVLNAQGEVVAGLWFEVCVAKEKIGGRRFGKVNRRM